MSIAAAYGNERVPVHLFLPKGLKPPYQTVIYYPGANGYFVDKFDSSFFENVWNFLPGDGPRRRLPGLSRNVRAGRWHEDQGPRRRAA